MTIVETPIHVILDREELRAIKTAYSILDNIYDRIDYNFILEKENDSKVEISEQEVKDAMASLESFI